MNETEKERGPLDEQPTRVRYNVDYEDAVEAVREYWIDMALQGCFEDSLQRKATQMQELAVISLAHAHLDKAYAAFRIDVSRLFFSVEK